MYPKIYVIDLNLHKLNFLLCNLFVIYQSRKYKKIMIDQFFKSKNNESSNSLSYILFKIDNIYDSY